MRLASRLPMPRSLLAALSRSRRSGSRMGRALDRAVVVLCYHDLRDTGGLDSWLRVDVDVFRNHLGWLSSSGTIIAPSALEDLESLPGPGPHFLLTFDDGYANCLRLAVPVLEELRAPAFFFVTTEHVLTGEPFWFDRVVVALQSSGTTRLDLRRFGLADYRFRSGPPARRWDDVQRLLTDLKRPRDAGTSGVDPVLQHLDSLRGDARNQGRDLRPLRVAELKQIAGSAVCHFGSHAHRHEILTQLDQRAIAESLVRSKSELEGWTGRPVRDVAYPNGDCDERVIAACSEAAYERGFTTTPGVLSAGTNRFRIPRLLVGGYDSPRRLADKVARVVLAGLPGLGRPRAG